MDPLSITASVIGILHFAGSSGQLLHKLLSLRDAPQQLQQLWNEVEALRTLVLETQHSLCRRREFDGDGYAGIVGSIAPVLETVRAHVVELDQLIHFRLTRVQLQDSHGSPKVNRTFWLRAGSEVQRIKQNIRDSRELLQSRLELLGLHDGEYIKTKVLQIQHTVLTSQNNIGELRDRQQEMQHDFRQLGELAQLTQAYIEQNETISNIKLTQMNTEQRQNFAALQASFATSIRPLLDQMKEMTLSTNQQIEERLPSVSSAHAPIHEPNISGKRPTICVTASIASEQCPRGCQCQCHSRASIRTPIWFRNMFGQLLWNYNSSVSIRSCNHPPCRKSLGRHHFTYYFPSWLISRAICASANLDHLSSTGAKVMVNIPLIIPEENHIVWSLVIAGNLEQLQHLLSCDKNLVHVQKSMGPIYTAQLCVQVAVKIHQPVVFNYLLSIGMDEHLPDENQKTAATTVLTRRGSKEYELPIDEEDLADRLCWTPLHKAATLTQGGRKLTEALLESDHDAINSKDTLGRTPLHWLAERGEVDAIRLFTQDPWRANVHTRDNCGFTALHCACWADCLESATALLDAGSDPNAQDKHERTPLLHFDDHRLLDLMIERGANVYISDDEGCNMLHHVAVSDQAVLVKILLERYGGTLCIPNHAGDTPLGLAVQNNSLDVLRVLLPCYGEFPIEKVGMSNHRKHNALNLAAMHASTETMGLLSAASIVGLDENARDKDGHTPNDCFLICRNAHCAVARRSYAEERRCWNALIQSVREHAEVLRDGTYRDQETMEKFPFSPRIEHDDSFSADEATVCSVSEDEFVDAEDGYEDVG